MDQDLSAREAARRLGISVTTLYAYVSRGLVQSRPGRDPRSRRYRAADIERLLQRRAAGRGPRQGAAQSLDWGLPVLETRISQILEDGPHYRGHAAVTLAREGASLEQVACLLWNCTDDPFASEPDAHWPDAVATIALRADLPPLSRTAAAIPLLERTSSRHFSTALQPQRRNAAVLTRQVAALLLSSTPRTCPVHHLLADAWRPGDPILADQVRQALVLCADHELNASAFAARVVASTGASLHAAVVAGLAALSGPLHGGATARAYALIDTTLAADDMHRELLERWQRGDPLPGFGHPLYPRGDPRGGALLQTLYESRQGGERSAAIFAMIDTVESISGHRPSIDFALATLAQIHGLPAEAALALFAAGRVVGWLAHAIEQHSRGGRIRPRARYVDDGDTGG